MPPELRAPGLQGGTAKRVTVFHLTLPFSQFQNAAPVHCRDHGVVLRHRYREGGWNNGTCRLVFNAAMSRRLSDAVEVE
jgi:hypothetical protein